MKRYLILVLALVMTLSAFACTQKETAQNNDAQQTEPMPEAEATAEPEPEATAEPEPEVTAEPEPMPVATEWPESIVDIWVLTKAEYSGITMNMANLGMNGTLTFDANGKVTAEMNGETSSVDYTVSGMTVTFTEDGQTFEGVYDPVIDAIVIEQEENGQSGKLYLERQSTVEARPAVVEREIVDVTAEDAVGTWELTQAKKSGIEIPVSMIGITMTLTLNADGTASVLSSEETADAFQWTVRDGKVVLSALGRKIYEIAFDGVNLLIEESNTGVTLIFEKQN